MKIVFFIFPIIYISTNAFMLPNGFYNCECFTLLPANVTKGRTESEETSEAILSKTTNGKCSNSSDLHYVTCCTQSFSNEVNFCCLDISSRNSSSPQSTTPTYKPSTRFSLLSFKSSSSSSSSSSFPHSSPSKASENFTNLPKIDEKPFAINSKTRPKSIEECIASMREKELIRQSLKALSYSEYSYGIYLKYLLVICMIYPFFVLALFLVFFFHNRKRKNDSLQRAERLEEHGCRWSELNVRRIDSPPPSYSDTSAPSYGHIFTISSLSFSPLRTLDLSLLPSSSSSLSHGTQPQDTSSGIQQGAHPVLLSLEAAF